MDEGAEKASTHDPVAGRCRIAVSLGLQLRRQDRLLGIEGVGCEERTGGDFHSDSVDFAALQ